MKLNYYLTTLLSLVQLVLLGQSNIPGAAALSNSYIPEGGNMAIFSTYNFASSHSDNSSIIYTYRGNKPGIVNFGEKAHWIDAGEQHYIDGYAAIHHSEAFTFPIGDNGHYRPLSISGSKGFTVAYYYDNPHNNIQIQVASTRTTDTNDAFMVSPYEYWHISGNQETQITIPFEESSQLSELTESAQNLRLLGWDGQNWTILNSTLNNETNNKSALSSGSISTVGTIIPNDFPIITFGIVNSTEQFDQRNQDLNTNLNKADLIEFTIFPNPVTDLAQVKLDYRVTNIELNPKLIIYDAFGQLLHSQELGTDSDIISFSDLTNFTSQVYQIGIINDKGSRKFETLIVNRR